MPHPSDPGIPTLTQRAEPTLAPATPAPPRQTRPERDDLPVLTEVADPDAPVLAPGTANAHAPQAAGGAHSPQAAFSTASQSDANTAVLRAALQAELEQTLQRALDDATAQLRARLEAELPALIDRAVKSVRPG